MRSLGMGVEPFLIWAICCLVAIALLGVGPQFGLIVALAGGVAMGVSSLAAYPSPRRDGVKGQSKQPGEE